MCQSNCQKWAIFCLHKQSKQNRTCRETKQTNATVWCLLTWSNVIARDCSFPKLRNYANCNQNDKLLIWLSKWSEFFRLRIFRHRKWRIPNSRILVPESILFIRWNLSLYDIDYITWPANESYSRILAPIRSQYLYSIQMS